MRRAALITSPVALSYMQPFPFTPPDRQVDAAAPAILPGGQVKRRGLMPAKNHKTDKLYVNRDEVAGNLRGTTRIEPVPRVPLLHGPCWY